MVSLDDVLAAREAAAGRLHRTPFFRSLTLGEQTGANVHLKAELFQKTGSFKPRGVLANLAALTPEQRDGGVISISAGTHAQALAWGAAAAGIDALLVMWQGASEPKIAATRGDGLETGRALAGDGRWVVEWVDERAAGLLHEVRKAGIGLGWVARLEIVE